MAASKQDAYNQLCCFSEESWFCAGREVKAHGAGFLSGGRWGAQGKQESKEVSSLGRVSMYCYDGGQKKGRQEVKWRPAGHWGGGLYLPTRGRRLGSTTLC